MQTNLTNFQRLNRWLFVGCVILVATILLAFSTPFGGRAQAEAAPTKFTIAVVPDTQNEVFDYSKVLLDGRYNWLSNNKTALNLKFVSHVGDVVNWGVAELIDTDTTNNKQFANASASTNILDASGIPYSYAIGNHDTAAVTFGGSAVNLAPGESIRPYVRDTSFFNSYFPLSRFKNVKGEFEPNKVDNMYQTFQAGDKEWLMLTLELWPRPEAITWAKQVVEKHPNHNIIINTHAYIDGTCQLPTSGFYGHSTPQILWDQLISQYPNIRMVLSGHYGPKTDANGNVTNGTARSEVTGVNGNKIQQIMTAYHSQTLNHVRLLEIDTAADTLTSSVYVSTTKDGSSPRYITDTYSNFTATNMNWVSPATTPVVTAPSAPQNVAAVAGNASATISFGAPISDGGTPVTSYTVTAQPGGLQASGVGSPITLSGLTNGTAYTFTVTATNNAGTSVGSNPSSTVTPMAPVTELLPDPGFESGFGNWIPFSYGTFSTVTSPVYGGTKSLSVLAPADATLGKLVGIMDVKAITNSVAGKSYTVKCYVKPSTSGVYFITRFLQYTQNYSSNVKIGTKTGTLPANTWTLVEVTGTATANGMRIIPQLYTSNVTTASGPIYYDNCSLTAN